MLLVDIIIIVDVFIFISGGQKNEIEYQNHGGLLRSLM